EEVADPAIENRGTQDGDAAAPAAAVLLCVVVNRGEDLGRLRVAEHRPPPARLPRPGSQRDEQRFLDRAELHLHEVCHTSHYTPALCPPNQRAPQGNPGSARPPTFSVPGGGSARRLPARWWQAGPVGEQPLPGGFVTNVVRVGNTVRRAPPEDPEFVRA